MAINKEELIASKGDVIVGLFCDMLEMGRAPKISIQVIAFWIWLQIHGVHNLLTNIASSGDILLELVSHEGETVLAFLMSSSAEEDMKIHVLSEVMHVTCDLSHNIEFHLDDIVAERERIAKDITEICDITCHEFLHDVFKERMVEVGSSDYERSNDVKVGDASPEEAGKGGLNPNAEKWSPDNGRAPEEERCLFLTFSIGYPLSSDQIEGFFTRRFGPCIERIHIHKPKPEDPVQTPIFGRVCFTTSYIAAMVLGGKEEVEFILGGRTMKCKPFKNNNTDVAHSDNDD